MSLLRAIRAIATIGIFICLREIFKGDFQRKVTAGFPEWYKEKLVEGIDIGDGDASSCVTVETKPEEIVVMVDDSPSDWTQEEAK